MLHIFNISRQIGFALAVFVCASCTESEKTQKLAERKPSSIASHVLTFAEMDSGYDSSEGDWDQFLKCWGQALVEHADKAFYPAQVPAVKHHLDELQVTTDEVRKRREQGLRDIETRLKLPPLPKSYLHFIQETGGHWTASLGIEVVFGDSHFVPFDQIGYFKDIDKPNWESWHKARGGDAEALDNVPADTYYRYDNKQDRFRWHYIDTLIKVGELEQGAILGLNPREISRDGEWEAWLLSSKVGAYRYRSFGELLQMVSYQEIKSVGGEFIPKEQLLGSCARFIRTVATK